MKFEKSITNTFGFKKTTKNKISTENEFNLAHLGYPGLWQMSFFLTFSGLKKWQEKQEILFPNTCCCCDNEKTTLLPYYEQTGGFFNRARSIVVANIPHCDTHANSETAKLIVAVSTWTETVIQFSLTGMYLPFLSQSININTQGDVVPPWIAFPHYNTVTSGWRQGEGEYWWNNVWQPFWQKLVYAEKQRYLTEYCVPTEWREYFQSTGDTDKIIN